MSDVSNGSSTNYQACSEDASFGKRAFASRSDGSTSGPQSDIQPKAIQMNTGQLETALYHRPNTSQTRIMDHIDLELSQIDQFSSGSPVHGPLRKTS